MNIDTAFPSNYLKAADLNGKTVKVTIAGVKMEDVGGDHKPCLYFQGHDKGIVLNKTNSNNISTEYGRETDNWAGKPVWLYTALVDFQGKTVEAIRVRTSPPPGVQEPAPQPAPQAAQQYDDGLDDEIPF